jgi:hypothetical protein
MDTPETDAAFELYSHHLPNWLATEIIGAVARRMERERNEALREIEALHEQAAGASV